MAKIDKEQLIEWVENEARPAEYRNSTEWKMSVSTPDLIRVINRLAEHENVCPECGGDGIGRCDNPDHEFIDVIGGLGCPVCRYDPDHKTNDPCECCNGTGTKPDPRILMLDNFKKELSKYVCAVTNGVAVISLETIEDIINELRDKIKSEKDGQNEKDS